MEFELDQVIKKAEFDPVKPFVVGVSGGADSIFLLDLMVKADLRCIAAHFNHQIRSDAEQDANLVEKKARDYGVRFYLGKTNVVSIAQKEHLSIEEAARKCRYRFLFDLAEEISAQAVVVAHHANDQVETILMHFLRGAGLDGLQGMQFLTIIPEFHSRIPLFRPLLTVWREEIETYCEINQINYSNDPTNLDITYTRNKLRQELIPQLEKNYPGFKSRLLSMSNILQADSEILRQTVNQSWGLVKTKEGEGYFQFDKHIFLSQPIGIQRRIIRQAIISLQPGWRDISFDTIELAITNINQHTSGEFDLVNFSSLILHHKYFYIIKKGFNWYAKLFPQIGHETIVKISNPGGYLIHPNWRVIINQIPVEKIQIGTMDPDIIYLDAHLAGSFPWNIRNWQPGDRFRPFGMRKGKMKLGDLFINEKVLKPARKNWPVLTNKTGQILWVVGLRADDQFRVQEGTKSIFEVKLVKSN